MKQWIAKVPQIMQMENVECGAASLAMILAYYGKWVWLPVCRGGCPHRRLFRKRECLSFKTDPEAFALKVYEARKKKSDQSSLTTAV